MHVGDIHNATAAGRVFRCLIGAYPQALTGWALTVEAHTTAVGTRVSEVRDQLAVLGYPCAVECERDDKGYNYRLVVGEGYSVRALGPVQPGGRWEYRFTRRDA